eukprot:1158991-Pelagomonas_calceolata.AAC.2
MGREPLGVPASGSPWPEPAGQQSALKRGIQTRQNILCGQPGFGDLGCSGQSLGATVPKVVFSTFPAQPPQAPGTVPVDTHFISIL